MWSTLGALAQLSFYRQYSGTEYDFGQGVVQLPDSSYAITGRSGSWGFNSEAFILKVHKDGSYDWSQHYGGAEYDEGRRILSIPNQGYFVAGSSLSNPISAYDVYLVKTDMSGSMQWEKRVDLGAWDFVTDALLAADSGLLCVGYSQEASSNLTRGFVLRLAQNGDTLWSRYVGTQAHNSVNSALLVNDSTLVVAGTYYNLDSTLNKGFLAAYHVNGNPLWFTSIGDNGVFGITDLTLNQNRYNLTGWKYDPALDEHDNYSGRYELNGSLFYESVYVNPGDVILDEITLNGAQTKLYVGYRNENMNDPSFGLDVTLGRFNTNYDWDNGPIYINHGGDEKVEQFIPTSDGGALAVGWITYPMNGGNSIFLMKIGPNDEVQTVVGNEPFLPLVEAPSIDISTFSIFPNPGQDVMEISVSKAEETLCIFDAQGQLLQLKSLELGTNVLDMSRWCAGVYFIQCGQTARKWVKL
jgi:hypothetical protein